MVREQCAAKCPRLRPGCGGHYGVDDAMPCRGCAGMERGKMCVFGGGGGGGGGAGGRATSEVGAGSDSR